MATTSTPTMADLVAATQAEAAQRRAQRMAHLRSGAAGTHADSRAAKAAPGTFRTNRVGSRSAQDRAAVADQDR